MFSPLSHGNMWQNYPRRLKRQSFRNQNLQHRQDIQSQLQLWSGSTAEKATSQKGRTFSMNTFFMYLLYANMTARKCQSLASHLSAVGICLKRSRAAGRVWDEPVTQLLQPDLVLCHIRTWRISGNGLWPPLPSLCFSFLFPLSFPPHSSHPPVLSSF